MGLFGYGWNGAMPASRNPAAVVSSTYRLALRLPSLAACGPAAVAPEPAHPVVDDRLRVLIIG